MPVDFEPETAAPAIDFQAEAPIDFTPESTLADFMQQETPALPSSPVTPGVPESTNTSTVIDTPGNAPQIDFAPVELLPLVPPLTAPEAEIKLPRPADQTTFTGGALTRAAELGETLLNRPEYVAGMLVPPVAAAEAIAFGAQGLMQLGKDVMAGIQGDRAALGKAAVLGGALALPLAAKGLLRETPNVLAETAPASAEALKAGKEALPVIEAQPEAPTTAEPTAVHEATLAPPDIAPTTISEGPGAASPGDIPKASELKQLTDAIENTEPVKQPLSEQAANLYANVREQIIGKAETALDTLKTLGNASLSALKGEHAWTDFKEALGKFSGEYNRNDYELQQFTHEIKRVVPDKMRREAIVNWLQADGDKAVLEERAAAATTYKRGYELATQLTPDEIMLADNVRSYLDSKLQAGIDAGLLKAGVDNYVSQVWDRPNPITQKLVGEIFTGKLAPNPKFIRQRIFQSYFEGEQAGFRPKIKDIGALTAIYDQSFSRAISSRRLIKSLHEGTAADGRPLVEVSGVNVPVNGEAGATEALLIKPKVKPEEAGDYLPIDHPALRGWRWAGTDEKTGATVLYQGDLLVHPDVHSHLKNVLSTSAFRQNVFTRSILEAASLLKQSKLALSGFHFTQEGAHAMAHRVNPLAPERIDFTKPEQTALVDHGLQIADYRAFQAFSEGISGAGSIYERIPGVGKWLSRYNEFLFQEYIPRLKMTMATDALARNRERYGGKLSEDQLLELTANQSNAAFGELNYTMLGRNPTFQDMIRLATLAPDFLEARGRFVAQALTRTGGEQRTALALQAATLYVGARILNQALDGDPHWEPKYAFSVLVNKRQYGIRSVVEDTAHLLADPSRFIANRMAPFARAAIEFSTGRDWRGIKRTSMQQVGDLAEWLLPITFDKQPQHTRTDQALQAAGVTVRSATAQQRLYEQLNKFKTDKNLLTKEEQEGAISASEYAGLRSALAADDLKSAKTEYNKLLHPTDGTKPKTPQQVRSHFVTSVRRPFSGSPRIEKQFVNSLDKKGIDLYLEAQRERKDVAVKFTEAQQKWMQAERGQ